MGVLDVTLSTSLAVIPTITKHESDAQGFFLILHLVYDVLGRKTLQGVLFEHNIRIHLRTYDVSSLKVNKNLATFIIITFNICIAGHALYTIDQMEFWFFVRLFSSSLLFVLLIDAIVDLVTCYLLKYSMYNCVYSGVIGIKSKLKKHMKNIVGVNKRSTLNKSQGTDGAMNFDTNALKE